MMMANEGIVFHGVTVVEMVGHKTVPVYVRNANFFYGGMEDLHGCLEARP